MTTKTIEKKVNHLSKEVASLRFLITKVLAVKNSFETDSFQNYKNSKVLKASFNRALKDWRAGRIQNRL